MRRFCLSVILVLCAHAAFASNARSAVSVNGLDSNACTVASPCRSFSIAIGVTTAGGEVIALDSAGYGPFSLFSPVSISGAPGVHAAISTTGATNAITVDVGSTDLITIRNLVLIGPGETGGDGIDDIQAGELRVIHCVVRDFQNGIVSLAGHLTVDDSTVLDNAFGIGLFAGAQLLTGNITNSLVDGNSLGIDALGTSSLAVTGTTITKSGTGIAASSTVGSNEPSNVLVTRSSVTHNINGVEADASGTGNTARLTLADTDVAFNTSGVVITGTGVVASFGNNRFVHNGTDGAAMVAATLK